MNGKTFLFPASAFFILLLFTLSLPAFAENDPGETYPVEKHIFHTHTKGNITDLEGMPNSETTSSNPQEDESITQDLTAAPRSE